MSTNNATDPTSIDPRFIDETIARRAALREKHRQGVARLMEERSDLRGVNALADFVDESLRWTA